MQTIWHTEQDLSSFVEHFGKEIFAPFTIGLTGQLGAGKTTFVKYLAKRLNCSDLVSSPSYVLEQRYRLPHDQELVHWDLYRLSQVPDELLEPPLNNEIRVIEWVEKFPELIDQCDRIIKIALLEKDTGLLRVVDY